MTDFTLARRNMVDGQLRPNRVTNSQLLAVIGALPREKFLSDGLRSVAYSDEDVPLGNGRFLMEPMVLARLIQTLQPRDTDRALVVASGRGYGAALLARLVKSVVAVESDPALAAAAERTAKLRLRPGRHDLKLLDGIDAVRDPAQPRRVIVGRQTIDDEIVREVTLAADRDAGARNRRRFGKQLGTGDVGRRHPRHQQREIEEVPAVHRQAADFFLRHRRGNLAPRRFDNRRLS